MPAKDELIFVRAEESREVRLGRGQLDPFPMVTGDLVPVDGLAPERGQGNPSGRIAEP